MAPRLTLLALALFMSSCSRSTEVVEPVAADPSDASHILVITNSKTTYSWDEVGFHGGGIVATIANPDARDYFSNVGDGFNSSIDQPTTYIAAGTEATVERRKGDGSWSAVPTGVLIEGSRIVALRRGGRYQLRGVLIEPSQVGTLRIRLRYRASTEPDAPILADYSAPFYVRQVFAARPRGR
jgi:hypothetical protein